MSLNQAPNGDGSKRVFQELAPYMALGTQMMVTLCTFGGIGWLIDSHYQTSPIWTVSLLVFGCVAAMVGFIKTALKNK
ncbi:MAG: AtpZ/AtpI family protein [Candidatus Kapaibacterium sp.]